MTQITVEQCTIGLLVLFSIATWVLTIVKLLALVKSRRQTRQIMAAWPQKAPQNMASRSACGHLLVVAQQRSPSANATQEERDLLERALHQQIRIERRGLERGLPLLASVASTSPFIGLFGTVWGIMSALKGIGAAGTASLDTVAGPVGSALIATGIGIAVAVPAVLFYNALLRMARAEVQRWQDVAFLLYDRAVQCDAATVADQAFQD